ncbi:MAG: sigma-70 family RNA polymerase sigma factor [Bacillota bacterium]
MPGVKAELPVIETNQAEQLEYLMRRFGTQVMQLAYFYLKDRHQAEDLAQEVFLKVYLNMDKFRGDSSYYTWIYRITVNLCRDRHRAWSFRNLFPVKDIGSRVIGIETIESRVLKQLEADEIMAEVLCLPIKYREVIVLHYYHDLTTPEIARVTALTEENVRVRLHRGRILLKQRLEKRGEAGGGPRT